MVIGLQTTGQSGTDSMQRADARKSLTSELADLKDNNEDSDDDDSPDQEFASAPSATLQKVIYKLFPLPPKPPSILRTEEQRRNEEALQKYSCSGQRQRSQVVPFNISAYATGNSSTYTNKRKAQEINLSSSSLSSEEEDDEEEEDDDDKEDVLADEPDVPNVKRARSDPEKPMRPITILIDDSESSGFIKSVSPRELTYIKKNKAQGTSTTNSCLAEVKPQESSEKSTTSTAIASPVPKSSKHTAAVNSGSKLASTAATRPLAVKAEYAPIGLNDGLNGWAIYASEGWITQDASDSEKLSAAVGRALVATNATVTEKLTAEATKEALHGAKYISNKVMKTFKRLKVTGWVVAYLPNCLNDGEGELWHVVFSDRDEEDWDFDEVK